MDRFTHTLTKRGDRQAGINMVDLMMWLVIAAMLLAAALQGIGYYQQGAYVYQMKEATDVAASRIMALASEDGSVDADDADSIVAEVNADTPDDEIFFTVETVNTSASGEKVNSDTGFSLMSVTTATTLGAGETFYIRAAHEGVSKSDVVYFFKDIASQKAGLHLVAKGTNGSLSGGTVTTPTSSPTATTSPTSTPTPTATPTPTPTPTATIPAAPADFNAAGGTIIASTVTFPSYFGDRTTYTNASAYLLFGFKIQEATTTAQEANFKVEFSGGENIGLKPTVTNKQSTGDRPWYATVYPTSEGYKLGTGKVTAKVTNLTSGAISYKTWTITVLENEGMIQSTTWASFWSDRSVYSLTSKDTHFGFQIKNATQAEYNVVFTGDSNININPTQSVTFQSTTQNQYGADWYSNIRPTAEGFKTGTGTITATATHKGTGVVYTKTWTLTVQEGSGIVESITRSSWWNDETVYSKTSGAPYFGFQINGARQSDYTVVFTGSSEGNIASVQTTQFQSDNSNSYRADWYASINPKAEGFMTGNGTVTATATHNGTGTVFTKTWNLSVLENPGIVQSHYTTRWTNKTVAAGYKTGQIFGFEIKNAKESDYTVVFTGNGAATNSTIGAANFYSGYINDYDADWYSTTQPGTAGFTTGVTTVTATATHKATGHVYTKTWTLTVQ